ncbi:hypothetical protein OE88DRAFT_1648787 [Heliocybe sulcata]|uniref:Uncharacterized protein n=1 Tax=Heliocybe sulcata TaxID=5364 RepID=A0A5C3MMR9_9AGAM|nr:hypothetical protein OE88DRAFT_1648787 [Heliocybe sulcata]
MTGRACSYSGSSYAISLYYYIIHRIILIRLWVDLGVRETGFFSYPSSGCEQGRSADSIRRPDADEVYGCISENQDDHYEDTRTYRRLTRTMRVFNRDRLAEFPRALPRISAWWSFALAWEGTMSSIPTFLLRSNVFRFCLAI